MNVFVSFVFHLMVTEVVRLVMSSRVSLGLLELISHSLLSKLTVLSISDWHIQPRDTSSHDFTISMDLKNSEYYHQELEILLMKCDAFKRNPQVLASIESNQSQDLSTLTQKHIKKLKLCSISRNNTERNLFASWEFPYCPEFTHFAIDYYNIDDSVPAALMKAVKNGKFPNLRRIELRRCGLNDCEWPEVPEFYLFYRHDTSGTFQIQKLLFEVTEMTVNCITNRSYQS